MTGTVSISLNVLAYSDKEILWKLSETLDENGVASAHELAQALGYDQEAVRFVGSRLAWMRRYGTIEKQGMRNGTVLWTLTPLGRRLLDGTLSAEQRKLLNALSPGHRISVMERLAGHALDDDNERTLLRRSWQNGTGRK